MCVLITRCPGQLLCISNNTGALKVTTEQTFNDRNEFSVKQEFGITMGFDGDYGEFFFRAFESFFFFFWSFWLVSTLEYI